MAGMYSLTRPSLLDDDYDEQQTAALAALAAQTPELDPGSQFPETQGLGADWSQPVAPPAADPVPAAAAALAAAGQPPAPTPAPVSTYQAPEPPAAPDPLEALMRRGEEQRQKQLDAYDAQGAPGPNGWAILADVVFNKGKSIPGILQQADADKRAHREGRQRLLTGAHSDPVNQMLAMERIRTGQGNLAARTDGQAARAEALRKEQEADALAGDRFRQYALEKGFYDPSMEGLGGKALAKQFPMRREDKTLALAPELNAAAGDKAEKQAEGRVTGTANAEAANLPTITSNIAAKSDADEGARAPHRTVREDHVSPIEQARLEREAEALRRQTERDNKTDRRIAKTEARQDLSDAVSFNKDYSKNTDAALKVAKSVGVLEDSLAKNPQLFDSENNMAPGVVSMIGGDKAGQRVRGWQADAATTPERKALLKEQIAFRDNYLKAAAFSLKDATGLSGNLTEQDQNTIRTGASPNASLAEMQAGLEIMSRDAKDRFSREGVARPDLADKNLRASGLDPSRWAPGLAEARQGLVQPTTPDPELGPGQIEVLNDDGDLVVEGAGVEGSLDDVRPPAQRKPSPASPDGSNLGSSGGRGADLPPPSAAPPKTIGGDNGAPLLKFKVNGRPYTITQEQAEWIILNKPGATVEQL